MKYLKKELYAFLQGGSMHAIRNMIHVELLAYFVSYSFKMAVVVDWNQNP